MFLFPSAVEALKPHSGTLTDADKREDVEYLSVSRVARATGDGDGLAHAQRSRIRHLKALGVLVDHETAPPVVVGVDERVRQHLAQGLVYRRIVIPRHVVRRNLERNLHPRRDRLVDAEEEVEDVAAPVGVA